MVDKNARVRGLEGSTHLFICEQILLEDGDARQVRSEIVSPSIGVSVAFFSIAGNDYWRE